MFPLPTGYAEVILRPTSGCVTTVCFSATPMPLLFTSSSIFLFRWWNINRQVDHRWLNGTWRSFTNKDVSTTIFERAWMIWDWIICIGLNLEVIFHYFIRFHNYNPSNEQVTVLHASTSPSLPDTSNFLFKTCLTHVIASASVLAVKHSVPALQPTKLRCLEISQQAFAVANVPGSKQTTYSPGFESFLTMSSIQPTTFCPEQANNLPSSLFLSLTVICNFSVLLCWWISATLFDPHVCIVRTLPCPSSFTWGSTSKWVDAFPQNCTAFLQTLSWWASRLKLPVLMIPNFRV